MDASKVSNLNHFDLGFVSFALHRTRWKIFFELVQNDSGTGSGIARNRSDLLRLNSNLKPSEGSA